ncbi:MAG TPA: putative leader peptide [Jatrophihabitantaceae bacterium]|nr:putative leader peptide [Jatrophihabitantaceae bacterium]
MGIPLFAVSARLTSRRAVDLCRVGSCLCRCRRPAGA